MRSTQSSQLMSSCKKGSGRSHLEVREAPIPAQQQHSWSHLDGAEVLPFGELYAVRKDTFLTIHPCSAEVKSWCLQLQPHSYSYPGCSRTPRQPQMHTSTDFVWNHTSNTIPLSIYHSHTVQWNLSKRNQTQPVFACSKLLSLFQNIYRLGNQHNANPNESKYLWATAILGLDNYAHALDFAWK